MAGSSMGSTWNQCKENEITVQVILWDVLFFNFCDGGSAHGGRRELEAKEILASEIKPRLGSHRKNSGGSYLIFNDL